MKVFSQLINEVLNPEQKKKVDSWDAPHHFFSDHMFEKPTDTRAYFELEHPDDTKDPIRKRVEEHLKKHDIDVEDYVANKAKDRYGRPRQIGRALRETNAPESLLDHFTNASSRQQQGKDLIVAVSRHPHDVAGMTSEGQSWENHSCMNFSSGGQRGTLRQDVRNGTHVAYLIHRDDKEIQRPLARIALKPFHNEDDASDTILRPEDRTYGDASDAFTHTVNKIINKKFPGTGFVYKKDENVYDDSIGEKDTIVADIKEGLNHPHPYYRKLAIANPASTKEDLKKALADKDLDVRLQAFKHNDINEKHLSDALKGKYGNEPTIHEAAAKHPLLPEKELWKLLKDTSADSPLYPNFRRSAAAASNPNITEEQLDYALNSKNLKMRENAAKNKSISKKQLSFALGEDQPLGVRVAALKNSKTTTRNLEEIFNNGNPPMSRSMNIGSFDEEDQKVRDYNKLKEHIMSHPKRNQKLIMAGLSDSSPNVRAAVFQKDDGKITPDHVEIGMNDENGLVSHLAIQSKAATHDQLERAIATPYEFLRTTTNGDKLPGLSLVEGAMKNHNLTNEQLEKGLAHPSDNVKAKAIQHHKATPEQIGKMLDHPSLDIRLSAIQNPNADSDNIHKAIRSSSPEVRMWGLDHPNATRAHFIKLLNDPLPSIRYAARSKAGFI